VDVYVQSSFATLTGPPPSHVRSTLVGEMAAAALAMRRPEGAEKLHAASPL
jgi:hypothetical protein